MLPQQATINHTLSSPKFVRRNDLTLSVRVELVISAYMAQIQRDWGKISSLSKDYNVSRSFIYNLLSSFKREIEQVFLPANPPKSLSARQILTSILSQRFEGRCSIEAISTLMKRWNMDYSSMGSISQILSQIGKQLPNTLDNYGKEKQLLIFFVTMKCLPSPNRLLLRLTL